MPSGVERGRQLQRNAPLLRRAAIGSSPEIIAPPLVQHTLLSPGKPLDAATRAWAEPRFGHDFSRVRIHTDAQAAESARAVDAVAYTVGRDIAFDTGKYAPHERDGQALLAHELTHVVQQRHAASTPIGIGAADDAYEQEARSASLDLRSRGANIQRATSMSKLQRQPAPQTDDKKKTAGEKQVVTQPAPQRIPAATAKQQDKPTEEKKGVEVAVSAGGEAEFKSEKGQVQTEGSANYTLEVTIPITDKLHIGPLSFLKEGSVEASGGFKFTGDKGTLTNLEAATAVKVISLDWEKVKVPLGIADFGLSASVLSSAEYSPMEQSGAVKFGVGAEGEAKFKTQEKSPFFLKLSVGVEKTYDKEGNANFKWSPMTWKTGGAVGVEF